MENVAQTRHSFNVRTHAKNSWCQGENDRLLLFTNKLKLYPGFIISGEVNILLNIRIYISTQFVRKQSFTVLNIVVVQ